MFDSRVVLDAELDEDPLLDRDPLDEELDDPVLAELGEHPELGPLDLVRAQLGDPARVQPTDLRLHVGDRVGGVESAAREPDGPVRAAASRVESRRRATARTRPRAVREVAARQYASRRKFPPVR